MQHLDLGIAQHAQDIIATAGHAKAAVHGLLVNNGGFITREARCAEGCGEGGLQFGDAFRGRGRQISEDLVDVHGAGNVARRKGCGVACINDDYWLACAHGCKLFGADQYFAHARAPWSIRLIRGVRLCGHFRQHLAQLLGGWRHDAHEIGFAHAPLGAVTFHVTARSRVEHGRMGSRHGQIANL